MIIGYIAGIILSFVGVWILNKGFWPSVGTIGEFVSGGALLFAIPALLMIYTSLVIGIVNQAFSLIHVIPDKVMRWIGAPSGVGIGEGAREGLGQAREAAQGFGRDVGGGLKSGTEHSGEALGKKLSVDNSKKNAPLDVKNNP